MTSAPAPSVARAALVYHPRVPASQAMAGRLLAEMRRLGITGEAGSAWDEEGVRGALEAGAEAVVTLGGDGTILRALRQAAPFGAPILGVNFGRLGFLAEFEPDEALTAIAALASGALRLEQRLMLACTVSAPGSAAGVHHVVNDVFVGRGRVARAARLRVAADGAALPEFAADGVLVATPTGSTAYNLSAGGPAVFHSLEALLVTPVVPHPTQVRPLVLPADTVVDITVLTDEDATLSLDGQTHFRLANADALRVEASPYRARFLRTGDRRRDLDHLFSRLNGVHPPAG